MDLDTAQHGHIGDKFKPALALESRETNTTQFTGVRIAAMILTAALNGGRDQGPRC